MAGVGQKGAPFLTFGSSRAGGANLGASGANLGASVANPVNGPDISSEAAALGLLLRVEGTTRDVANLIELKQVAVNEVRKVNRARQIFLVEIDGRRVTLAAASGISVPDRHAPLTVAVTSLIDQLARDRGLAEPVDFALPAYARPNDDLATAYPFRQMAWVPFASRDGRVFGGLLMARETIWSEQDRAISIRLAGTLAHAWRELETAPRFRPRARSRRVWPYATAAAVLAMLFPVPMTALAPVEIVARNPVIVAAPIDGVIETIEREPGTPVASGDVLLRLSDTVLRNRFDIAGQEAAVAEAKLKQATILAFGDAKGRHELGIAQAELVLKRAEVTFAAELLERSVIRAQRAGIVVYADKRSLIGRPVATGERIMEIANPSEVEARIDLALPDAIALKSDSAVTLFLDIAPLAPLSGRVVRTAYKARPGDGDVLSFQTFAHLNMGNEPAPRIGLRGTAQVIGDRTVLGIVLFRRPISAIRQWLGV